MSCVTPSAIIGGIHFGSVGNPSLRPGTGWATKVAPEGTAPKTVSLLWSDLGVMFSRCIDMFRYVSKHRFLLNSRTHFQRYWVCLESLTCVYNCPHPWLQLCYAAFLSENLLRTWPSCETFPIAFEVPLHVRRPPQRPLRACALKQEATARFHNSVGIGWPLHIVSKIV